MFAQSKRAEYGATNTGVQTPKSVEYQAFARITHQLCRAMENPTRGRGDLAAALHNNRRLWTILASDLASQGNGLDRGLRAQLLSLAAFSLGHSRRALGDPSLIAQLVELNTTVMKGLRGEVVE